MTAFLVPRDEVYSRIGRAARALQKAGLDALFVTDPVNLLYFTGTLQSGLLYLPARGEPVFFVRRSLERANLESPLEKKVGYVSFREVKPYFEKNGCSAALVGIEEAAVTLGLFRLLQKNLPETVFRDAGDILSGVRALKSPYEIAKIRRAGEISREVMALIPSKLKAGITEWELGLKLYPEISDRGRCCFPRLAFGTGEFCFGNICFGDSSLYPSRFDGPGGLAGKSAACPYMGSDRRLEKGDLVYIDLVFPFEEYCVDKTRVFSMGAPAEEALRAHAQCLLIQAETAKRMSPGAAPSAIYSEVMARFVEQPGFQDHFMGYAGNQVKFLGHGLGMTVNEYPVIAKKFDEPLLENMVIALEPKKAIPGLGMVGVENTFLITREGAENLTADSDEITVV